MQDFILRLLCCVCLEQAWNDDRDTPNTKEELNVSKKTNKQEETPVAEETVITEETAEEATGLNESEAKLAAAEKQAQDNLDGWQRERADFSNYKRRIERELAETRQNATNATLKSLLPVLDDYELALANKPAHFAEDAWVEGIVAIQRKFLKILEDYGVEVMDPVGQEFDPTRHEAIGVDTESDAESGTVTQTLQKGYINGDKVLRSALVKVAG